MTPFRSLVAAAIVAVAPLACLGQVDAGAKEILEQSAQAIKNSNGLEMTTARSATGLLANVIDASGTFKLLRNKDMRMPLYLVDGRVKEPTKGDRKINLINDGTTVTWLDHDNKELIERGVNDNLAKPTMGLVSNMLVHAVFLDSEPFERELRSPKIERVGVENLNGEVCDLISIAPERGSMRQIWAISAIDRLPRRLVQAAGEGPESVAMIFEVKTVKPTPMTPKDFALELPAGYSRNLAPAPVAPTQNPATQQPPVEVAKLGVMEGEPLPGFEFADSTGAMFNNDSIAEGVTVMYFFGTLFKPSITTLGDVQALQEQYRERGVRFVAVACREPSERSAAALFTDKQIGMKLIPRGDDMLAELKVMGFPSCYVLGPEGRVVSFFQGPATRQQMAEAIDRALGGK